MLYDSFLLLENESKEGKEILFVDTFPSFNVPTISEENMKHFKENPIDFLKGKFSEKNGRICCSAGSPPNWSCSAESYSNYGCSGISPSNWSLKYLYQFGYGY